MDYSTYNRILAALSAALLVWSNSAHGARILAVTANQELVTVSNEELGRRWQLNDTLCLFQQKREIACGFVGRLTTSEVVVKLETRQVRVVPGHEVELRRNVRHPSSTTVETVAKTKESANFDITLGVVAGLNYLFVPVPQFQVALGRSFSLGIEPLYASFDLNNAAIRAYGGFINLSYYYTHFAFRGLLFNVGGGMYNIEVTRTTGTQKQSPIAMNATVQWRGKAHWGLGVDIGVGAGLQAVFADDVLNGVATEFNGVLPLFTLYLGYSF